MTLALRVTSLIVVPPVIAATDWAANCNACGSLVGVCATSEKEGIKDHKTISSRKFFTKTSVPSHVLLGECASAYLCGITRSRRKAIFVWKTEIQSERPSAF